MLRTLLKRIRDAAETDNGIALTFHEGLMIDAKFFELEQLVLDHRRLIDFLLVDEKAKERACVVAWLRAQAYLTLYDDKPDDIADRIERGEHRREGGE